MKRARRGREQKPLPPGDSPQLHESIASRGIVLEEDDQSFDFPVPRLASKETFDSDYDL